MGVALEPHVSTVGFHRLRGPAAPKAKILTLSLAFKVLQGRFLPLPLQPHPHRPGVETEALRGDHTCQGHSVRRWQSQIQIQACRDQSLGLAAPLPCPGCSEMLPPGGTCPPVGLVPKSSFHGHRLPSQALRPLSPPAFCPGPSWQGSGSPNSLSHNFPISTCVDRTPREAQEALSHVSRVCRGRGSL